MIYPEEVIIEETNKRKPKDVRDLINEVLKFGQAIQ